MRLSLNNLLARKEVLEGMISYLEEKSCEREFGKLWICSSRGHDQFYLHDPTKKGSRKNLGSSVTEQIKRLAQQEYDNAAINLAKSELKTLNILIKKYMNGIAEDIYMSLTPIRQKIVDPVMMSDEQYIRQWLDKPYTIISADFSDQFESGKNNFTDSGLAVRSKSEASIYNKYDQNNIPVRYEDPLFLEGFGWVIPDFRLLNVRRRIEFIHEHMGRMDDPDYAAKNIPKINWYMRNGYFPGKNLILTFETKNEPFDPRLIDDIIEKYLK